MLSFFQNKIKKEALISFVCLVFCLAVNVLPAGATEVTWPTLPGNFTITDTTSLPELVRYLFNFSIMIAGLMAFLMLVSGGFRYLTSAGNAGAQKDARDMITSAILGLLLLLSSYLLLQVINPDILILRSL